MSKVISVKGWVPKGEREAEVFEECGLNTDMIRLNLTNGVYPNKKEACSSNESETNEYEKVRVTVTIDVERI